MAVLNHYHVIYHFEIGGKPITDGHIMVACADNSPATIKTAVTVTAGKSYPGGTFVLDAVKNLGDGLTN